MHIEDKDNSVYNIVYNITGNFLKVEDQLVLVSQLRRYSVD
jgi:hypothetical protein